MGYHPNDRGVAYRRLDTYIIISIIKLSGFKDGSYGVYLANSGDSLVYSTVVTGIAT